MIYGVHIFWQKNIEFANAHNQKEMLNIFINRFVYKGHLKARALHLQKEDV